MELTLNRVVVILGFMTITEVRFKFSWDIRNLPQDLKEVLLWITKNSFSIDKFMVINQINCFFTNIYNITPVLKNEWEKRIKYCESTQEFFEIVDDFTDILKLDIGLIKEIPQMNEELINTIRIEIDKPIILHH